jgi:hypothetical protein
MLRFNRDGNDQACEAIFGILFSKPEMTGQTAMIH